MNTKIDTSIFKQVDKFIRHFHDLELVFKAPNLKDHETERARFRVISTRMSESILAYQRAKNGSPTKIDKARICLYYINRAFTMGFIEETESVLVKARRLSNELDECNKRCKALAKENKRLHKFFGNKSFVGDVKDE
jgi:hypothetical protein